jgi:hypothetical protein
MKFSIARALAAGLVFGLCATAAVAQDEPPAGGKLLFQLNNAQTVEGACQLTFVIKNDTGTAIEKSSYNMAIVNAQGQVSTLITFEFRPLPVGRTKVQQFNLAGQPCDNISAISINEFVECLGGDGAQLPVCENDIEQSTKTDIQFPWEL